MGNDSSDPFAERLKEACLMTDAAWAVLVDYADNVWTIRSSARLARSRILQLEAFLSARTSRAWLAGALAGGRPRSHKLEDGSELGCTQLCSFPVVEMQSLLLVGAADMDASAQRLWKLVASTCKHTLPQTVILQPSLIFQNDRADISYYLPNVLERILGIMVKYIPPQGGWLAIHSGEQLTVKAHWMSPQCFGQAYSMDAYPVLRRVAQHREGVVIERDQPEWESLPGVESMPKARVWAAIPFMIGQRLIGAAAIWRAEPISAQDWQNFQQIAANVTTWVELMVTFDEMSNHLSRLALLNDFALTVSSARNLDHIARRVFALLTRTFHTDLIALTLLSIDGTVLREYRNRRGKVDMITLSVEEHPRATLVRKERLTHWDGSDADGFVSVYDDVRSALTVPLKSRGQVIGALSLESLQPGAFGVYDEHLLVVIASHLAGLVEYGRIREEAEARARNLGLIHEVVQQVIGLTNKAEVAQITADLLAQFFGYELTGVMLQDGDQKLSIIGLGGSGAALVRKTLSKSGRTFMGGITKHVLSNGKSIIINDVSQSKLYTPIEGWEPGAEMCVPLRDGERAIGLIDIETGSKNAFTHNDLIALESLAGILAGVVSSAEQYQRLQAVNRQLRAAQEELQARIQAQRAAESRLVQAAKLAAVGEMAAGIAHELNNPLTTIAGFAELVLEESEPDSSQHDDLDLILRESHRARSVVRRLLDFARQSETVRVRGDLNEIIRDAVTLTSHLLRSSGVQLNLQLEDNLPWILMDRNQMKQVVLNLMHNAMHAMPEGGSLDVITQAVRRDKKDWVTIDVVDTGVGIPPENIDRIFEPFFTTRSDDGGTGLGLSVTYGIVTDHGGYIDVQSQEDVGSQFTVWLPVEEES
jgi:signal transduction histidine kinase